MKRIREELDSTDPLTFPSCVEYPSEKTMSVAREVWLRFETLCS